ncbi:glycosyltransferase family 4 protein [candidate division CSSED10-310 bacterium]|uniref:Glycosyltransferase family 4 protein n=1 Tax=candidate division CSSED10-310 bacterium TaxID=2855610 RepID=A0ABV6YQU9_UNCC1
MKKKKIALICSEPIRQRMGGIGIRFVEFARQLLKCGFQLVFICPELDSSAELLLSGVELHRFSQNSLLQQLQECSCAIAQGQLANNLVLGVPDLPSVIDLYDPWLVENFQYFDVLGYVPYGNDHTSWRLQMSRGDFFLCSSEEQRLFYLGFLTALGRVHPELEKRDPDFQSLITPVPFGVPDVLPPYQPLIPRSRTTEKRLLFGGLYDWYDPWTLLYSLEQLGDLDWTLLFMKNPNPETTPQQLFQEVENWAHSKGYHSSKIQFLDWVPAERRYDLFRDVDVLVAPHLLNIETRLSFRTRILEALAAGCAVITTDTGLLSRLIKEHSAGWVVPEKDVSILNRTIRQVLTDQGLVLSRKKNAQHLAQSFHWSRTMEPLIKFCTDPRRDTTKTDFSFDPGTRSPRNSLYFRLKHFTKRIRSRCG